MLHQQRLHQLPLHQQRLHQLPLHQFLLTLSCAVTHSVESHRVLQPQQEI
jgi:hypothetical protein